MLPQRWPWRLIGLLFLLYLGFAIFYMVTLHQSYPAEYRGQMNWSILYQDYTLKALFTLPVWYLTFRVVRHWSLPAKLALNLALLPVWVKSWQLTYYWLDDTFLGGGHLEGSAQWWDVYIPGLFYVLQFGIFHAWSYYHDLMDTERARAETERLALSTELSALKAQLNPHFLYNAFNTISASTGPAQEHTRDMIAQLSDLFRYQLRANQEPLLPLREELEFVSGYLRLEKERFGDRLTYRVRVDDMDLNDALVPPLLLQPLVENAVRHGIAPRIDGGSVYVEVHDEDGALVLYVSDDGEGFDPATAPRGYGLTNTGRRLRLLFDTPLTIHSTPGQGTRCSFSIPLTYAPQSSPDRRRSPRPQLAQPVPR